MSSGSEASSSGFLPSTSFNSGDEYVLALHDFAPTSQSADCLYFKAGEVIHVLNRDTSGWWDGQLGGKRGWFPSNYVTSDVRIISETLPRRPVS